MAGGSQRVPVAMTKASAEMVLVPDSCATTTSDGDANWARPAMSAEIHGCVEGLAVVDDPVDQPPLEGLLGRQPLGEHREFHCSGPAHQAGQEESRTAVRDKADPPKGLKEVCRPGRD